MDKTWLWHWLLPPERFPLEATEAYMRAVGVVLIALAAIALIGAMGAMELVLGGTFGRYLMVIVLLLVLTLAGFRHYGGVTRFGHLTVGVVILGIAVLMAMTGGRAIGGAMMLPLFVLLAMLVLPRWQGALWALVAVAAIGLSYALASAGAPAWLRPHPQWAASAGYRVPIALCVLSAMFGLYFMRSYRELLAGLEQSRRSETELLRIATLQKERFVDFALVAADWFWETDADDRLVHVSAGFGEALGLSNEEVIGCTPTQVASRLLPPDRAAAVADLLAARSDFTGQLLRASSADGEHRILSNSGRALWSREGEFLGYRGAAVDVTALQGLNEELRYIAETDSLTGLANRRSVSRSIESALGGRGWLLFMDLDGFKAINDTHGHDAGDAALRDVAQALLRCARDTDVVARLGGDEFAILLLNDKHKAAELVATRVLDEVAGVAATDTRFEGLGISIGMARLDGAGSVDQALIRADAACYAAKRAGRHRFATG